MTRNGYGPAPRLRADGIDTILMVLFLLGIYLGWSPKLAAGIPLPCALSALAGMAMLLRNRHLINPRHVTGLFSVIVLYLISIVCVPDTAFLGERFKGFIQLSYSLVIAYAAFITATLYDRDRLARIFLWFTLFILVGCFLETHTPFGAVSDAVRGMLFDQHLYDAAERDQLLYGGIRPKLFTSEPSYVAFGFTAFSFFWYVLSTANGKTIIFACLLGAGMLALRSPTLVLGFALIAPYQFFVAGRSIRGRTRSADHAIVLFVSLALIGAAALIFAGGELFAERIAKINEGNDASFFYRMIGPAAVAWDTAVNLPLSGAGLSGEDFIADRVSQIYLSSPSFNPEWDISKTSEVLTNYFWMHWIYLGPLLGLATLWALGRMLRSLQTPSVAFCFCAWAIMGQSAGAYVSPKPWMILLLSAAVALLHFRQAGPLRRQAVRRQPRPLHPGPQIAAARASSPPA